MSRVSSQDFEETGFHYFLALFSNFELDSKLTREAYAPRQFEKLFFCRGPRAPVGPQNPLK